MKFSGFHKADLWIEKIISYPGIDDKALMLRKDYWIASLACFILIVGLTVVFWILHPEFKILLTYGVFLTFLFLVYLIAGIVIPKNLKWLMFVNQILLILGTFAAVLKLGGILHSGGLIFIGFFVVLFSLDFQERRNSVWLFVIYIITLLLAWFLNPYLTTAKEMTPGANISLFAVNLLWISVFAFAFVLNFISQRVNIEKREADHLKEIDAAKTKLYTNITHEFRTPLTVIQGMADIIRDKSDEKLREETEIIERNGNTLLHLVNQMLDLSKLETNAMPVHMIQADIIYYIRYLVNSFRSLADIKNITFQFRLSPDQFVMDYDPDKLMQIMSNLISNAFKFTPAGGKVEIFSRVTGTEKQTFELRIKDNGEGIPEDHIPHIFDRFYRVETRFRPATRGSGLGLALTRELVKMFKGTINVSSVYGKGTEFIVCLPVTRDAALEEISDYLTIEKKIPTAMLLHEEKKTVEPVEEVVSEDKPLLLVVEDSHDVVLYLHTILRGDYNVQVAYDGRKGLQKALELMPDIILTDIMMPEMDGIELLDKIKNDIRTSHIPVVVLTAKADLASRLTGLERGADVYIAKPFNKRELLVQLNKLIKLRKKLQERYAVMGNITISRDKAYKTEDSFMQKIRDIMFVNLEDGTFDIQKLCQHLAISRAQLYRKFKFLTNKTIADYFRSLRLHKARELLLTSGANVSDAAYQTGFKNLSHFSKVFTKEFGINPSEIQK